MGGYDFTDNLVTLTRFRSPTEATLALARLEDKGIDASLDGDAAATSLGHLGADLVGASLLVRQGDYRRAKEILADLEEDEDDTDEPDDYDADDWSGEDWADDDDPYEEYSEEPALTPPLVRAWRAAVIGIIFLPMNLYSWWLILKYELWLPESGSANSRWRFYATVAFNLIGILFFWSLLRL
ncbi:MAG: DUF2007 domain-containing protein [Planctomycetes bacterium]|nr:DUF2007 domain-containing protein [Planctomycetota bacterium]